MEGHSIQSGRSAYGFSHYVVRTPIFAGNLRGGYSDESSTCTSVSGGHMGYTGSVRTRYRSHKQPVEEEHRFSADVASHMITDTIRQILTENSEK